MNSTKDERCTMSIPFGYVILCPHCKTELFTERKGNISYNSEQQCPECQHKIGKLCPKCWGRGDIMESDKGWKIGLYGPYAIDCPKCNGTGRLSK